MKALLLFLCILCSYLAHGQELKLVSKTTQPNPFTTYKEEYYVMKGAHKVKHGAYKKWTNNILTLEGFYENNKMDSTWTRYGGGGAILSVGNYANDEKAGIWKFYENRELEQEYDFTTNKIIYFKPETRPTPYPVIIGMDTTYQILSRHPMVIGGSYAYGEIIAKNLKYPISAHKNNKSGRVFVTFVIDETGKTSGHRALKEGDKNLDEEAVRVVKLIDNWIPAMLGDKAVKIIHIVPITFTNAGIIR